MKPVDFDLHRPETLKDALDLLAEHADAKVLAGGQSLIPLLNFRLARPEHLIDLNRIASLRTIKRTRVGLAMGAMVRYAQAERSAAVARDAPLLAAAIPHIAHAAIRARGTIGGSLAHGDPAAELPAVATALDATLVVAGPRGERRIAARDFFLGNLVTALQPDEILVEIHFDRAPDNTGAAFHEVARRRGDFALVGAAVQVSMRSGCISQARICLTGVSAVPYRVTAAEEILVGQSVDEALLEEVGAITREAVNPSADLHATAEYRRDVAGTLVARAVRSACEKTTVGKDEGREGE